MPGSNKCSLRQARQQGSTRPRTTAQPIWPPETAPSLTGMRLYQHIVCPHFALKALGLFNVLQNEADIVIWGPLAVLPKGMGDHRVPAMQRCWHF